MTKKKKKKVQVNSIYKRVMNRVKSVNLRILTKKKPEFLKE